jgi:hypothetical protein
MNIHSINQMNSQAIASLEQGGSSRAVTILKKALASLLAIENEVVMLEDPKSSHVLLSSIQSVAIASIDQVVLRGASDGDLLAMYPRAFIVQSPPGAVTGGSFHLTILVILYNLALALDVMALATERAMTEQPPYIIHGILAWRKNAIELYKAALHVASDRTQEEIPTMSCLLLAAINNLGRLQSQRHCFADTKDCLRTFIHLYEGTSDATRKKNVEDFELLLGNLAPFLCVKDNLLSVAPAA